MTKMGVFFLDFFGLRKAKIALAIFRAFRECPVSNTGH